MPRGLYFYQQILKIAGFDIEETDTDRYTVSKEGTLVATVIASTNNPGSSFIIKISKS